MREMSDLRLEGRESSWHSGGKQPGNLKAWWLKMSFWTIVAALARVIASSENHVSSKPLSAYFLFLS